jgi:hypothetical protein
MTSALRTKRSDFLAWNVAALCTLALVGGCATPQQRTDQQAEFQRTIPTCKSDRECELKWSAARQWVLQNAGMKIQHITNDFIETYNPVGRNSAALAARVVKEPILEGGYRLVITTWCGNMFGCVPNASDAALQFDRTVNAVRY